MQLISGGDVTGSFNTFVNLVCMFVDADTFMTRLSVFGLESLGGSGSGFFRGMHFTSHI